MGFPSDVVNMGLFLICVFKNDLHMKYLVMIYFITVSVILE